MAKRPTRRVAKKIQPAVETLLIPTPAVNAGQTGSFTIDLSQCASLVNRRFYRQGINWAVAGFKLTTSPGVAGAVTVKKLPQTWIMSNAWEKGFRLWQQMNKNAVDEAGMESIKGKFLDFKIFADETHFDAGFASNLIPVDGQLPVAQPYTTGQWQPSEYEIPLSDSSGINDRMIVAVGPNGTSLAPAKDYVSLIQGYADSRALPYQEDPNVPDDASLNWQASLFNEGTLQSNAVIGNLEVTGDKAPYPFENDGTNTDTMYPGGETQAPALQIHDISTVSSTTVGGITHLKGGNFPCGLIRVDWANTGDVAANIALQIDLVPGHHRGYLCQPMQDM